MRKSPGFTAIVVMTLALGIGANTAIFSALNAIFFHPLPVSDPKNLVEIFTTDRRNSTGINTYLPISYPNGEDVRRRAHSFSDIALYVNTAVSITANGEPYRFAGQLTSGNFFDLLGVQAAWGRFFHASDDGAPGANPVVVLSYGLWQRRFAGDPKVIGQSVLLNGHGFTIIGVTARGFQGTSVLGGPELWIPMSMHDLVLSGLQKTSFNERDFLGFYAIARLKSGTAVPVAGNELRALGVDLQREYPIPNDGRSFTILPLLESTIDPNFRGFFLRAGEMMMTVVGLVLLIACVNIANLLLVRAAGRRREISIRLAIGAARWRIVLQLLTESLVLAMMGAIAGLGFAWLGSDLLWRFRPPFLQDSQAQFALSGTVLLFNLGIAFVTGLIFGLVPSLRSTNPNLVAELKERIGTELALGRRTSLRSISIVGQVALSFVVLVTAGVFLLSLHYAALTDVGFDTRNLGMLSFDLGLLNYDGPRAREFQRRALETMQTLPEVHSAAITTAIPLLARGFRQSVFPEGQEGGSERNGVMVRSSSISSGYFEVMGISLLRGRGFDSSVREDTPLVAIINQTASQRFWPSTEAVGKRFKLSGGKQWIEVIGVAKDAKYATLGEDPTPYMYLPLIQSPSPSVGMLFRTKADPQYALNNIRGQVQALDRNLPITNVWPIGDVISEALGNARFEAGLLLIFALIALALCAVGVYGIVSYSVGQRMREIGIRLALGAQPHEVRWMVIRQNAAPLLIGLAAGIIASFGLVRLIANLLYGGAGKQPALFFVSAILLVLVGLLAASVPAYRAARIDPLVVLHSQ
jgi:macrolide transport system ATP-binding/permease protein